VPTIKDRFGIHYQTALADLEKLVEAGILRQLSAVRPKTYYAHEVMGIAYHDSASTF
jgi:hypothetical protein